MVVTVNQSNHMATKNTNKAIHSSSSPSTSATSVRKPKRNQSTSGEGLQVATDDILRLVMGFLAEGSFISSLRALENEVQGGGGPTDQSTAPPILLEHYEPELAYLRDLILDGNWCEAIDFIAPFKSVSFFEYNGVKFQMHKGRFLEMLSLQPQQDAVKVCGVDRFDPVVIAEELKILEDAASVDPDLRTEFNLLCSLLTLPQVTDHPNYSDYTVHAGRFACFEGIKDRLRVIFPGNKWIDRRKEVEKGRLMDLVLKGLLYEGSVACRFKKYGSRRSTAKALRVINPLRVPNFTAPGGNGNTDASIMDCLQLSSTLPKNCPVPISRGKHGRKPVNCVITGKLLRVGGGGGVDGGIKGNGDNDEVSIWLKNDFDNLAESFSSADEASVLAPPSEAVHSQGEERKKGGVSKVTGEEIVPSVNGPSRVMKKKEGVTDATQGKGGMSIVGDEANVIKSSKKKNSMASKEGHVAGNSGEKGPRKVEKAKVELHPTKTPSQPSSPVKVVQNEETANDIPAGIANVAIKKMEAVTESERVMAAKLAGQKEENIDEQVDSEEDIGKHEIPKADVDKVKDVSPTTVSETEEEDKRDNVNGGPSVKVDKDVAEEDKAEKQEGEQIHNEEKELEEPETRDQEEGGDQTTQLGATVSNVSIGMEGGKEFMHNCDDLIQHVSQEVVKVPEDNPTYTSFATLEDIQAIRAVSFNPATTHPCFAVGSNSRTLRICSLDFDVGHVDSRIVVEYQKNNHHKGSIYSTAWNSTGEVLATGSNDKLIKVLRVDPGNVKEHMGSGKGTELILSGHDGTVRELGFSCNSSMQELLISGGAGDCCLRAFDYDKGVCISKLKGHSEAILSFAVKGNVVVSASSDRTVRVWDLRTKDFVRVMKYEENGASSVCIDEDLSMIAVGNEDYGCVIHDFIGGQNLHSFSPHTMDVRSVQFSKDSKWLLSSSYDKTTAVTHLESQKSYTVGRHQDKVIRSRWFPGTSGSFVSCSADKTLKCWSLENPMP
eukprot:Nk52_evm7s159 gene=Nk52_evmTU7s159